MVQGSGFSEKRKERDGVDAQRGREKRLLVRFSV